MPIDPVQAASAELPAETKAMLIEALADVIYNWLPLDNASVALAEKFADVVFEARAAVLAADA